MGKSATLLDIMGERLDNRPAPILYVGPTEKFVEQQFAPRVADLFQQSKSLAEKLSKGKQPATLRRVAGVPVRLAHGGSSSALKSDPASLALVDEYDELLANVKKAGDPLGLIEARGFTYADFVTIVASTPSRGVVDVHKDEASGLEFWAKAPPEDLQSPIWTLFQAGTMHHWAWACPLCTRYFIPRHRNLEYDPDARPAKVRRETVMRCPHCRGILQDAEHKAQMNASGLFVAYGQWVEGGMVMGEPEDSDTFSTWISGLCSPFQTWGDRAAALVEAQQAGEPSKVQAAINAGFGELHSPGAGEVPEWTEIQKLKRPENPPLTVPDGALVLTAAADVHKSRINVVIRAWGTRATSWKVYSTALLGSTLEPEIWRELADILLTRYPKADGSGDLPVKIAFVDSGYRPGKPEVIPENMVYDFCRRHRNFVFPTKGRDVQRSPLIKSRIEVNYKGQGDKYGLELITLHTDVWKSWIHERVRWDADRPGGWFLDNESDEDFARQIVSEARVRAPSGKWSWVPRSKRNHWLDCESMNAAAGYLLGVQRIGLRQGEDPDVGPADEERGAPPAPTPPPLPAPPSTPITGPAAPTPLANKFAMMSARINKR